MNQSLWTASHFEKFWARIVPEPNSGCWLWDGPSTKRCTGYGIIRLNNKPMLAHRFSWEYHHEARIPHGKMVCHSCDIPGCCNPDHLSLGDARSNTTDAYRRGIIRKGVNHNSLKTHCPHGHSYSGANLRIGSRNGRYCVACDKIRAENRKQGVRNE